MMYAVSSTTSLASAGRRCLYQSGNGAHREELLHGLMRRAVFAVRHGIVREDKMVGNSIKAESRMAGRA